MDTLQFDSGDPSGQGSQGSQGGQGGQRRPPRWSGRTRRVLATSAVGAVLLGSGAAIGVALTGGASAATGATSPTPAASVAAATTTPASAATSRCARIVERAVDANHPRLASRLHAFCTRPLLRLALVGGEHGQVTFKGKSGPTTLAFERGTVKSDTGSAITVTAADGTTWTWQITGSTVVRQAGKKVAASTVADGDQVFVGGPVVNGANDARLIRIRSAG